MMNENGCIFKLECIRVLSYAHHHYTLTGMQEEVLKLILLALEDGSALSRKVLVLFVVQRLEAQYPQASKTAIGHVVQLLYRASCFKVWFCLDFVFTML